MKFASGVLALAGLAAAAPEADPALLAPAVYATAPYAALPAVNPYAYAAPSFYYNPSPVGTKTVSNGVAAVSSVSGPFVGPKPISAIRSSITGTPLLQPLGHLTSRQCVTEAGCLVATLKGARLAKREADPQLISPYYTGLPYASPALYAGARIAPFYSANALPYYAANTLPYSTIRPAVTYVKENTPVAVAAEPVVVASEPVAVAADPVAIAKPVTYAPTRTSP